MLSMLWPILVVIAANTLYHISSKSVPSAINPFASQLVTYLVAAALSAFMLFLTSGKKSIFLEIGKINWSCFSLGLAVVGLEFGSINAYRAGWRIGTLSLITSISVACVLLIVGRVFYNETVSIKQLLGFALCGSGLLLIGI